MPTLLPRYLGRARTTSSSLKNQWASPWIATDPLLFRITPETRFFRHVFTPLNCQPRLHQCSNVCGYVPSFTQFGTMGSGRKGFLHLVEGSLKVRGHRRDPCIIPHQRDLPESYQRDGVSCVWFKLSVQTVDWSSVTLKKQYMYIRKGWSVSCGSALVTNSSLGTRPFALYTMRLVHDDSNNSRVINFIP